MARVKQFIISNGVKFFVEAYKRNYGLKDVSDVGYNADDPCLFVGCYYPRDLEKIVHHRGPAILVWLGSDARAREMIMRTGLKEDLRHVAISKWVSDKLESMGVDYIDVKMPTTDIKSWRALTPPPLGNKVYAYAPYGGVYNRHIVETVADRSDYEFIITDHAYKHNHEEMVDIYAQCFVGLRLTWWDGNPATVTEMGLMGRRVIWNGDMPNAIPWKDADDVVNLINDEAKLIGCKSNVADVVWDALDHDGKWLEI